MASAIKFPPMLADGNAVDVDASDPASTSTCWTSDTAPGAITVKLTPVLASPPTVTTTLPVVAPTGTGTTMVLADQLVGVAVDPLNLTVLVPCVAPKFVPEI